MKMPKRPLPTLPRSRGRAAKRSFAGGAVGGAMSQETAAALGCVTLNPVLEPPALSGRRSRAPA